MPVVLLALVVLSIIAVTSIQTAGHQKQAGGGALQSTKAFYAAEAGAHAVIAEWDSARYDTLAPNPGDSADLGWRILPANGAAYRPVFHRVDDGGDKLFSLTVEGSDGPQQGQRKVGVLLQPGFLLPKAAVTTRGTISLVEDATDIIDGNDTNPPGWTCDSAGPAVPAVEVAAGTSYSQGAGALLGNPTVRIDSTMDSTRFTHFGSYTYADLVAMADKSYTDSIVTVFVGPVEAGGECDTAAPNNWGDPLNPGSPCADYFPIIHFSSPNDVQFQLPAGSAGQGILLVDSRLDQDDPLHFYGLVISQNRCDWEHGSELYGALLCSNASSGGQQNHDNAVIHYSRCALEKATAQLGGSGVDVVQGSWKELTQ
ncbi:MAG: hypothetical protein HKM89_04150 [Gemmatimonadales bacterium]|nr:hypothetical protein [Gemmatimonadales bacterium]